MTVEGKSPWRCLSCISWRQIKDEQPIYGECWSDGRGVGEEFEGPAGITHFSNGCEAHSHLFERIPSSGVKPSVLP